jgi:hypothetical protein
MPIQLVGSKTPPSNSNGNALLPLPQRQEQPQRSQLPTKIRPSSSISKQKIGWQKTPHHETGVSPCIP